MKNLCYINLNTLRENAIKIKSQLPKNVLFNAVVKADAYGHGIEMVASAIYGIVDSYSVSILEEGIALRNSGIDKEILLLIPPAFNEIESVLEYNITTCCDSVYLLKKLNEIAKRKGKIAKVHLKYDTGMHRLGIRSLDELEEILKVSRELKQVKITGLFSHYYNSLDKNALKKSTDKFLLAIHLFKRYNIKAVNHISASGGFLRGNYFDMVRIGILLYGYKPFNSNKISVKPIMKVYARILTSFTLKKGEHCLYGEKISNKEEKITLIRYGFADGLERSENKEIFNNRCMVVSAIKGRIKGKKHLILNVKRIAKLNKTIPYEILTKIAIRTEKIYIN